MFLDALWKPYTQPSNELKKALPAEYLEQIQAEYKLFKKNPDKYVSELGDRQVGETNVENFHLSLPRRKRFFGNVPLGLELALFNTPETIQRSIIEKLALTDAAIGNIAFDLTTLPDTQNFLRTIFSHAPLSGSNLGVYAHSFFHNRFEMVGAPIFSLDDELYRELCFTDISKKTPCEFFRTPMPTLYLEFGKSRHDDLPKCWHEQSGWHCMEGAYLNTFTLTSEELQYECNDPNIRLSDTTRDKNKHNVISHALATGLIKPDAGDVQVTEILVTGSPLGKDHMLDDSTHQFVLVVQDRDMDIETLLDWHLRFNRKELPSQVGLENQGNSDHLPVRHVHKISDNEAETISNAVHAITKALLYINSETCSLTNINEASEQQKAIRRTKNKAKIRKLEKKARTLSDYILITLPTGVQDNTQHAIGKQRGSVSTHWRRAHFHTYRYGEGRKNVRVKWIPRTLINPAKGLPTNKEYKIK